MQSVSSRIWTRVAVLISYDENDYTTGTWEFSKIPIYPTFCNGHILKNYKVSNKKNKLTEVEAIGFHWL